MLRAVPAIMRIAASTSVVLRSAFFISTIFASWALVTLPTLFLFGTLLEEHARRRRLELQREAAILIYRDDDGDYEPRLLLRLGVELLAELHDVHAGRAERRTDGRRGIRSTGRNLELDDALDFLGHFLPFLSLFFRSPSRYPAGADGTARHASHGRRLGQLLGGDLLDLPVFRVDRDRATED